MRAGQRAVLAQAPLAAEALLADRRFTEVATALVGAGATIIRSVLFDKRPDADWRVPLHQDLTIALATRDDDAGLTHWTIKDCVHHAQPPTSILEAITTLRLQLDATPDGAIRVVPGSHRDGVLDSRTLSACAPDARLIPVSRGGALAMRPLTLHASSPMGSATRRRVLHLELVAHDLAREFDWHEHHTIPAL